MAKVTLKTEFGKLIDSSKPKDQAIVDSDGFSGRTFTRTNGTVQALYMEVKDVPDAVKRSKVTSYKFRFTGTRKPGYDTFSFEIKGAWTKGARCWEDVANEPSNDGFGGYKNYSLPPLNMDKSERNPIFPSSQQSLHGWWQEVIISGGNQYPGISDYVTSAVNAGFVVYSTYPKGENPYFNILDGGYAAKDDLGATVEIEYESVPNEIGNCSPSSGTIHKQKPNVFRWSHVPTWTTKYRPFPGAKAVTLPEASPQVSAIFRWRENDGATIKTIPVTGLEESLTVPGGTFLSEHIQWSVQITTEAGEILTSDWFSLSTQEVTSTAQAINPDGVILDGASPIEFAWKHIISTGTEPTGADIETGTNGTTFTRLAHVTGAATTYTAPKNALASGDVFWRVRTYNTDGKPGAWSPTARFVVVGAPPAPSVRVDKVTPCPKIHWQSATQQAYEIAINDRSLGVRYGTDKAYRPRRPLPDSVSAIKVRVQNKYGLWSAWGSVTIQIKNTPGPAITLTATAGIEATLRWTSSGAYPSYAVLRDGEWIAVVRQLQYTDRFTAGTHTYQIIGLLDEEGRHTVSNLDTVRVSCPHLMICAVDEPSWISLACSTSPNHQLQLQQRRDVRYVQYSGAQLPTAEMGSAKNTTYSFDAAWTHKDAAIADAFAALLGRLVCLKDPYGNAIIGILDGYTLSLTRYIRAYSCRLTAVNWKEVLDDPGV